MIDNLIISILPIRRPPSFEGQGVTQNDMQSGDPMGGTLNELSLTNNFSEGFDKNGIIDLDRDSNDQDVHIQTSGLWDGKGVTMYQQANIAIGILGSPSAISDAMRFKDINKLRALGTATSELKAIKLERLGSGSLAKGLGVVGGLLTVGKVGYDFTHGKNLTYGQVFDVALTGVLMVATFTNPVAIAGFAVYGILDATGALDSIKSSIGFDKTFIESSFNSDMTLK